MVHSEGSWLGSKHRANVIQEFLVEAAASRKRVLDDHMFAVGAVGRPKAMFRLQLLSAPGDGRLLWSPKLLERARDRQAARERSSWS